MSTSENPFKKDTGKHRLLKALRRGDVDAYLFAPVAGTKQAFDGLKPIGRLAPRVEEMRNKLGYAIDDVGSTEYGVDHSVYRLLSEPQSSPAFPSSVRDTRSGSATTGQALDKPAPSPHPAHVGIDFAAEGWVDDVPACPPAWQRSGLNPYEAEDDGDDTWILGEAA